MGPSTRSCFLCGYVIGRSNDRDLAWHKLFRIVYSCKDEIAVSGVGFIDDPRANHLAAPLDFEARWDTSKAHKPIGIVRQKPAEGRYGYPIHESCWSLLAEAFSPNPIPHERLFEICRSLPFSNRVDCITWNHDYGGLISFDNDSLPWEDLFVEGEGNVECASSDPHTVPEIQQLLEEAPESTMAPISMAKSDDIFSRLPLELITSVSMYLPTEDYLNARLASRSFYPVYHTKHFWASKFLPRGERSWLFEARKLGTTCDKSVLYRRTANGSPGIKNRTRVWRLVEQAQDLLRLEYKEPKLPEAEEAEAEAEAEADDTQWTAATADVRPETELPYHRFGGGCRQLREKEVHISAEDLSQIGLSVIRPGGVTYITGIRFIQRDGEVISLGYMADEERIEDVPGLTGFQLAVGSRGIQAIRCVLDGQRELSWVGNPGDAPKTNRLSLAGEISGFRAGFDGYKMVSLATTPSAPREQLTLRDSAFWYPSLPTQDLDLNEDGFTAKDSAINSYEPVHWTNFAGPSGEYLQYLTAISVIADRGSPKCIEFHYSNEDVPAECRKVGRCTPSDYAKAMTFDLDGENGETVDYLTVYNRSDSRSGEAGPLASFEIITNWGNYYHFDHAGSSPRKSSDKATTVAEGLPIHGLYWTQHENRIVALGAMTESF